MIWPFTKNKHRPCGLCGSKLGKRWGILKYRCIDDDEETIECEMKICGDCADHMDVQALNRK